jgi:hypothetical protein
MNRRKEILLRFQTILSAIDGVVGVAFRMSHYDECRGFPWLMIFSGAGSGTAEFETPESWTDSLNVIVRGWVKETSAQPAVMEMEDVIEKIRKAVIDDFSSGAVGSLGAMNIILSPGDIQETDSGVLSDVGMAYFELQFPVRILDYRFD